MGHITDTCQHLDRNCLQSVPMGFLWRFRLMEAVRGFVPFCRNGTRSCECGLEGSRDCNAARTTSKKFGNRVRAHISSPSESFDSAKGGPHRSKLPRPQIFPTVTANVIVTI
ncbi:hypothetical protein GCM10027562_24970 [Arthrobacter pigmenti]